MGSIRHDKAAEARAELARLRERATTSRTVATSGDDRDGWNEYRRIKRIAWAGLPKDERAHRVLNVVGDGKRTINEIADELSARGVSEGELSCELPGYAIVSYANIASFIRDLVQAGELRKINIAQSGEPRYAYARNRELSSEMTALEGALMDGES